MVINSDTVGMTDLTVDADYADNPYPGLMVNRDIYVLGANDYWSVADWEPMGDTATKTWIAHFTGNSESLISPAYTEANLGEVQTLTLDLTDAFGNAAAGYQVTWTMQGAGWFVTDDSNTITDPNNPAGNVDIDVTGADGQAKVIVKSNDPGEQIVHAKVRLKGTEGQEGQYVVFTAEVQWFDADVATFDDPTTFDTNEAVATNPVNTEHDFTLNVWGLKLEHFPTTTDLAGQTPIIDTDAAGNAYDGIFDAKDAEYFGGILLVNPNDVADTSVYTVEDGMVTDVVLDENTPTVEIAGRDITLSYLGGYTMFDWDGDGVVEEFAGTTGIYLPLEGKDVDFNLIDTAFGASVGSLVPDEAVTDENGQATVTVTSDLKGRSLVEAIVDWEGNPHNGPQLLRAYATKNWQAVNAAVDVRVYLDDVLVAENGALVNGGSVTNSIFDEDGNLNSADVEVHVTDQFGNELADYEVVYLLEEVGNVIESGPQAVDTYIPGAYLDDVDELDTIDAVNYDQNGSRPDHNEPRPDEDPFATTVGGGGYLAFYFNQAIGSETEYADGSPGEFGDDVVGPLTDGAKAWTRDGFFLDDQDVLAPNEVTGSNLDIVLAEDPTLVDSTPGDDAIDPYTHFKSILGILVYAPANGLAPESAAPVYPLVQIHKVWEAPVVDSITLAPASDVNAEAVAHTVTATVLDQFGNPYDPAGGVDFMWTQTEGTIGTDSDLGVTTTDGVASSTGTPAIGEWGNFEIVASADGVDSNTVTKYWAQNLDTMTYEGSQITLPAGMGADLDGQTFEIMLDTYDGTVIYNGTTTYDNATGATVTTSHTFTGNETLWVNFPDDALDNDVSNWYYGVPTPPIVIIG